MSRMISLFKYNRHARGRGGSMRVRVPLLAFALMLTAATAPQLAHAQAAAGRGCVKTPKTFSPYQK